MIPRLIDTHAHVSFEDYTEDEVASVLSRARDQGVAHIVNIGAGNGLLGNDRARRLASAYPDFVSFTLGVHPHDVACLNDVTWAQFERDLVTYRPVALGEVGLDYYYEHAPRDLQEAALRRFVSLALAHDLPLVIHDREAGFRCLEIIQEVAGDKSRGVVHCFTGTLELARRYLDLGFLISFTGIVTFKKADEVREVAQFVPLDRIMIETDSPYLAPMPHRGKRNEPAYVRHVAEYLADLKGVSLEAFAEQTTKNACQFFGLSLSCL